MKHDTKMMVSSVHTSCVGRGCLYHDTDPLLCTMQCTTSHYHLITQIIGIYEDSFCKNVYTQLESFLKTPSSLGLFVHSASRGAVRVHVKLELHVKSSAVRTPAKHSTFIIIDLLLLEY